MNLIPKILPKYVINSLASRPVFSEMTSLLSSITIKPLSNSHQIVNNSYPEVRNFSQKSSKGKEVKKCSSEGKKKSSPEKKCSSTEKKKPSSAQKCPNPPSAKKCSSADKKEPPSVGKKCASKEKDKPSGEQRPSVNCMKDEGIVVCLVDCKTGKTSKPCFEVKPGSARDKSKSAKEVAKKDNKGAKKVEKKPPKVQPPKKSRKK